MYEFGRNAAVDISPDIQLPEEFKSIHAGRPDLDEKGVKLPVKIETILWVIIALTPLVICAMLISLEVVGLFKKGIFLVVLVVILLGSIALMIGAMSNKAEGESFVLTQGVSVWPAVAIQLLAIGLCCYFYMYSRDDLSDNDKKLSDKLGLPPPKARYSLYEWLRWFWRWLPRPIGAVELTKALGYLVNRCFSIPRWHETKDEIPISKKFRSPQPKPFGALRDWLQRCDWLQRWLHPKRHHQAEGETDIIELWNEYRERRGLRYSLFRIIPQFLFFLFFV